MYGIPSGSIRGLTLNHLERSSSKSLRMEYSYGIKIFYQGGYTDNLFSITVQYCQEITYRQYDRTIMFYGYVEP